MKINRRAIQVVGVLGIAVAAGQLVQQDIVPAPQKSAALVSEPTKIIPVSAGPSAPAAVERANLVAPEPPKAEPPLTLAAADPVLPEPFAPKAEAKADLLTVEPVAPQLAQPAPVPEVVVDACPVRLTLVPQANAMIGLSLLAPCHAEERIVLRHAGLAVTGKTSVVGGLVAQMPALDTAGTVSVLFADGTTAGDSLPMPELASLRRFAVQWQDKDTFQVNAFENGADYGAPGHIWAGSPQTPLPGAAPVGGFLTELGDPSTTLPLMAQVYTFPADGKAEVVVEAAVTAATCGREILGETLSSQGGAVTLAELSLAMPDCAATGDILVLKNLAPDMKIAAAN